MDPALESSEFVNRVWVQCENEGCLKWRMLSAEAAARVEHSEPWYCFMNTDSSYNSCSVSEEDFPAESQFLESGYKIVYSQLPLGSLVLVKLQNWPSWPGILCPDPFKGKYVTYDQDGNVEKYHIEFLGDPHSTAWISATFVGHYSLTLKIEPKQVLKLLWWPRKGNAALKCSVENVCSDEALSKENMVVSETECLLKELEKMLQQVQEPTARAEEPEREQLSQCSLEAPTGNPFQSYHEEDCIQSYHETGLKAGECIENITNNLKKIDALISEF
ncbi:zinc finger CW-type PWWP domain protein 2 isoform X6 [Peromyscus maniculatus bairdii]|uniref:zinc finger CW-type PWWP domain protein 2 isoform X6 n=1 Tax=Peromyscus maniculatus bairdii TaxID=230844 RepID=UPI001C2EBB38|nr:zinc finger CW-type PWWP domain protein 2 isoform X3 [Peromyscus maniculatus bairdii]